MCQLLLYWLSGYLVFAQCLYVSPVCMDGGSNITLTWPPLGLS